MENKTLRALITGASSGIGSVYAERLARRGHHLILVARRADRLAELAAELKQQQPGVEVEVLPADLSTDAGVEAVERRLRSEPAIDILINNAGIPGGGPVTGASPERIDNIIALNVRAVARLAATAAATMRTRASGAIVNIASVIALMPEAGSGLYGPTKAFVVALSENLQAELAASGVYVQAVLPAATRTDIWTIAGKNPDEIPGMMEVGTLVDAALVGFDKREPVTIPSLPDAKMWDIYEAQRREIVANVGNEEPASRYLAGSLVD